MTREEMRPAPGDTHRLKLIGNTHDGHKVSVAMIDASVIAMNIEHCEISNGAASAVVWSDIS